MYLASRYLELAISAVAETNINPNAAKNTLSETPEIKYILKIAAASTEADPMSFCSITISVIVIIRIIIIGNKPSTGLFSLLLFLSIQAATNRIVPNLKNSTGWKLMGPI